MQVRTNDNVDTSGSLPLLSESLLSMSDEERKKVEASIIEAGHEPQKIVESGL